MRKINNIQNEGCVGKTKVIFVLKYGAYGGRFTLKI